MPPSKLRKVSTTETLTSTASSTSKRQPRYHKASKTARGLSNEDAGRKPHHDASQARSVTSFCKVLKTEHGIIVGTKVHTNELFVLYTAFVAGEIGHRKKLLKVYNIESWAEEHSTRLRSFYSNKSFWNIKGSPRVYRVIEDLPYIYILLEHFKESIFEHAAVLRKQNRFTSKQYEDLCATWFVQMLRALSRASDKGVFFERMCFPHIFFLNDQNQVIIADFSNATYLNNKNEKGWCRCKSNIVSPMVSPPEVDRISSGELVIEEDALISGEIWLAGAAIYQLLTNGSPTYEEDDEHGLKKIELSTEVKPPNFGPGLESFLSKVLDFEPEYRPKDYEAAFELNWAERHRKEAMVPTMESFRKEYKDLIKSTRGMKPKKSNASHSHDAKKPPSQSSPSHFSTEQSSSPFTKTFNYMSQGDHRILCQQNKHLREGCYQAVESDKLQRQFIAGYAWSTTNYEKKILEQSYDGLLPSSVVNRKPLKEQHRYRVYRRRDTDDFHSLTLYEDDYSDFPVNINAHMQGVIGDIPPPGVGSSKTVDFFDIQIHDEELEEPEEKDRRTSMGCKKSLDSRRSSTSLWSRDHVASIADDEYYLRNDKGSKSSRFSQAAPKEGDSDVEKYEPLEEELEESEEGEEFENDDSLKQASYHISQGPGRDQSQSVVFSDSGSLIRSSECEQKKKPKNQVSTVPISEHQRSTLKSGICSGNDGSITRSLDALEA